MRAFQIFSIVLVLLIISGYIPKDQLKNNTSKSEDELCLERGHYFDEESIIYVQKSSEELNSSIIDYEDYTVVITPIPYNIQRTCLRCGEGSIEVTSSGVYTLAIVGSTGYTTTQKMGTVSTIASSAYIISKSVVVN